MRNHANVRIARVYVRARAELVPEPVGDRVLDLEGHKSRMGVLRVSKRRLDCERTALAQVLLPGNLTAGLIKTFCALRSKFPQRQQHPHRDPAPKANAQRFQPIGVKANESSSLAYSARAQLAQLTRKEILGATRSGCEKLKALGHSLMESLDGSGSGHLAQGTNQHVPRLGPVRRTHDPFTLHSLDHPCGTVVAAPHLPLKHRDRSL